MKLLRKTDEEFVFEFRQRERHLLTAILQLYPLLNPDYHQVSRTGLPEQAHDAQQLLRDAMAERQQKNKTLVADFLHDRNWTEAVEGRYQLTFSPDQIEWLLQVLNDVRVGSWVMLGKPDTQSGEKVQATINNLPYAAAMEFSGYFQMALLEAAK